MMRVLYTHGFLSQAGSAIRREALTTGLLQAGHHVRIAGPTLTAQLRRGTSVQAGKLHALTEPIAALAANILAYRRLAGAAMSFRPDIIAAECDDLALAAAWLAARLRLPLFLHMAAPLEEGEAIAASRKAPRLPKSWHRRIVHGATCVMVASRALRAALIHTGLAADRIEVVSNGAVLQCFEPAGQRDNEGPLHLGFVGFVDETRGLDAVIRGMAGAAAPEGARLTIVGDGATRDGLEQLAATSGLFHRVAFTGVVPPALVPLIVGEFDIALLPWALPTAAPLSLFDYMAAGRAIVAPDQPNIREWLTHGETALLFRSGDPAAMWGAIATFTADPGLRRQYGEAARECLIARNLTWRASAERLAAIATSELDRLRAAQGAKPTPPKG